MEDINLDPLVRIVILSPDHLTLVQDAIHPSKIDRHIPADKPLYDTGDHFVLLIIIIREQAFALRFPDLLQDHVFRILHSDAPKCPGINVNIHCIAKLIGAVDHLRFPKADLCHAVLDILNHFLCQKNAKGLFFLIKRYNDIRQIRAVEVIPAGLLE